MNRLFFLGIVVFTIPAIFLSVWFRFSNLNSPFWDDELQTTRVAFGYDPEKARPSLKYSLKLHRDESMLSPPLFNILLHYWIRLSSTVVWSRLLSSSIGIVSLIYLFHLGREASFPLPAICLTIAVAASSWVFVHYSEEVATYSLSMLASTMSSFYLYRYLKSSDLSTFLLLIMANTIGVLTNFGNWIYFAAIGIVLSVETLRKKNYFRLFAFCLISGIVMSYVIGDFLLYRSEWAFSTPYLNAYKLNLTPIKEVPFKIIKNNLDFFTYVFGLTPWYLDVNFFPTIVRFGSRFTFFYYAGLLATSMILFSAYITLSLTRSINIGELKLKLLPLILLLITLLLANTLSMGGKYPIGPIRQGLFMAPLVIWIFMQFLDLILARTTLLTLVIVGATLIIIANGLTRLYRIPQRHIGLVKTTFHEQI